jgi:hypothetical protein
MLKAGDIETTVSPDLGVGLEDLQCTIYPPSLLYPDVALGQSSHYNDPDHSLDGW